MKRRGTAEADELSGTGSADTIRGLGGDDILHGGGGLDTIYGGAGNDTIDVTFGGLLFSGDSGADIFNVVGLSFGGSKVAVDGGTGTDTFDASSVAAGGGYLYVTSQGDQGDIGVGDFVLSHVEMIKGGFGQNYFFINASYAPMTVYGANQADYFAMTTGYGDVMYGLGGNDTFVVNTNDAAFGGDGDDSFSLWPAGPGIVDGGAGTDTLTIGFGWSVDFAEGFAVGFAGGQYVLTSIENVTISSQYGGSNILGDEGTNVFSTTAGQNDTSVTFDGRGGDDTLTGAGGIDTLIGGAGNDLLQGGGGVDLLVGGSGLDTIDGGDGVDNASYADQSGNVVISLAAKGITTVMIDGVANDTLKNVESLVGGSGDDTLAGNSKANTLTGGIGDDTLSGGTGSDTLIGGHGMDVLTGGSGADHFRFTDSDGLSSSPNQSDEITDFSHADRDRIELNGIDANTMKDGDQRFKFIGTEAFTGHAGELAYEVLDGSAFVSGDTNGDGIGDFTIKLDGITILDASDFRL